jgi:hypothetical protein
MKHTATAVIVALPLVCAAVAVAGPPTGVSVSQNRAPYGEYDKDEVFKPASGIGTYQASMDGIAGISANLIWGTNNSSSFVGECYGVPASANNASTGVSQTVMQVNLSTQSTFAITYDMRQLVGLGNTVAWVLSDSNTGDFPVYAVSFIDAVGTEFGGVSIDPDATSFTDTVPAGTYLLTMYAECNNTGGTFSYDATFTPVPAPGAIPAILMAAALRGRRRR